MAEINEERRYEQYWAYLRHVEMIRFQMAGLLVVVAGGGLGFVHGNGRSGPLAAGILSFLAAFALGAQGFLVAHRRSYRHYFRQLKDNLEDPGLFDASGMKWRDDPFGWLLALTLLLQVAVVSSAFPLFDSCAWKATVLIVGVLLLVAAGFLWREARSDTET